MTSPRPIEERISAWLTEEAPDDVPHRVLELTFDRTRALPQDRAIARIPVRRSASRLALIAAALLVIAGITGAVIGARLLQPDQPDLRARVLGAGVLRVAIRAEAPQALVPTTGLSGFDVDVARELASRLPVDLDLVTVTTIDVTAGAPRGAWDIAIASLPEAAFDPAAVTAGPAYYAWPRYVLVPAASPIAAPTDLAGRTVCAVAGDAGADWAKASLADGSATVVTRTTDDACLAELDAGNVSAVVTATLGPADLDVRTRYRSIGGPPVERRVVAAGAADRPASMLEEITRLLRGMADDGTLADLSKGRFGGVDLSSSIVKGG